MKKTIIYLFAIAIFGFTTCTTVYKESLSKEIVYQNKCGSCHLAPDPTSIPKSFWEDNILPDMAARLGYKYKDYNPYKKNDMTENLYVRQTKIYPNEPLIDSIEWNAIYDYVMSLAPDDIPADTLRSTRNQLLTQFAPKRLPIERSRFGGVTNIQFEESQHHFIIGHMNGSYEKYPTNEDSTFRFRSPIMSHIQKGKGTYVTEVGYMNPSEQPKGRVHLILNDISTEIANELHRPVYTEVVDLNDDGNDEIIICEYGNITGKLSILKKSGADYKKKSLLNIPGTINLEIADMNQDGKKDIVVLAAQGNEAIYILYQKKNFEFRYEQVVKMPAEYGSSWFDLIDYDGDDDLDIVMVNGDNADLSNFLKPYHGVRIFINEGNDIFNEEWFYPIYGATRLEVDDFDGDGDVDLAVASFFPDFKNGLEESFVYLENKNSKTFEFEAFTLPMGASGRWMTMDKGDFDQDGDVDLALGAFFLPLKKEFKGVMDKWIEEEVGVLLLENKSK